MPAIRRKSSRRKVVRRKASRRVQSRKNSFKRPSRTMVASGSPFARQLYTQFTYTLNTVFTCNNGDTAVQTFNGNSLYDPDATGVGIQPRYFDTLCGADNTVAPYRNYVVHGVKVSATLFATGSDTLSQRAMVWVGIRPAASSVPSTLAEVLERKDITTKKLGYWSGGHDIVTVNKYAKIAPILGVKDLADNPGTSAVYNANPTDLVKIDVGAVPIDEFTTITYRCITKITYMCKLFSLNDVSDS